LFSQRTRPRTLFLPMRLIAKPQQYPGHLARMRLAVLDVTSDQKANHDTDQVFHVRRRIGPPNSNTES